MTLEQFAELLAEIRRFNDCIETVTKIIATQAAEADPSSDGTSTYAQSGPRQAHHAKAPGSK